MPAWLEEVFLGYGDPSRAHYKNIPSRPVELDFRDTFVDWTHLVESFPGKVIRPPPGADKSISPPYILSNIPPVTPEQKPAKAAKRRKRETAPEHPPDDSIDVRTYKLPNMGPYPVDKPRQNHMKFMPAQGTSIPAYPTVELA